MIRALILAALLAGCAKAGWTEKQMNPAPDDRAEGMEPRYANIIMQLWVDKDTGCQYLVTRSAVQFDGGITPRVAADSKTHMGCKSVKP